MLKEAKKVPAIRFSGFTDSWEQRKLNEVLDLLKDGTHGTHQDADEGPLLLSAKNIKNGEIVWDDSDRRISIEEYKSIHSNFQLQPDDILLTIVGSIGETAILRNPQGLTFQRSVAFLRPNKHINSEFMCSEIQSTRFQNELRKRKSTSAQSGIYLGDLQEIPFIFPANPDEQRNISSYFYNLDNLIALHQRKLDQQETLKKYFLQNMFPSKGEKVPKIRLQGFTGDWKQHKLKEIYENIGNAFVGTATPYYTSNGHFYLESNNVKDGQINREKEVFINDDFYEKQKDKWLHTGDIVMVQSGHVGNTAVIPSELDKTAAHALIMFRQAKIKVDPHFLNYQFQTEKAKKSFKNITVGNTIEHILASSMKEFIVDMPSYIEQQSISHYFKEMDCLINLQQRKLGEQ